MSDVRFTDDEDNYVVVGKHHVGWFTKTDGKQVYFSNADEYTADQLRAIADKLDELNGVEK